MEADPRRREERPVTAARLQTENPYNPKSSHLQRAGQLRRAELLEARADELAGRADWTAARRLRAEAHHLRRLARGTRPEAPAPVDVALRLAAARLEQWAARRVA